MIYIYIYDIYIYVCVCVLKNSCKHVKLSFNPIIFTAATRLQGNQRILDQNCIDWYMPQLLVAKLLNEHGEPARHHWWNSHFLLLRIPSIVKNTEDIQCSGCYLRWLLIRVASPNSLFRL